MYAGVTRAVVRKPKYKPELPPAAARILEDVAPAWQALYSWLQSVVCTSPFTLHDAFELKAMIDQLLGPESIVDVYTKRGDKVFIRVQLGDKVFERALDVQTR